MGSYGDAVSIDEQEPPDRKGLPRWVLPVACGTGLAFGSFAAISLADADFGNWSFYLRDWAKSPGPAAIGALVAASVAAWSIHLQVNAARDAARKQETAARIAAWWQMFEWASERAVPSAKDGIALPESVTIGTLQQLSATAENRAQKTACGSMIDVLTERVAAATPTADEEGARNDRVEHARDAEARDFNALAAYVESTKGTPAASPMAEALLYERSVILSISDLGEGYKVLQPARDGGPLDVIIDHYGHSVGIVVKYIRDPRSKNSVNRLVHTYRDIRSRMVSSMPVLLVSPMDAQELEARFPKDSQVIPVQWRSAEDDEVLHAAIVQAATTGPR